MLGLVEAFGERHVKEGAGGIRGAKVVELVVINDTVMGVCLEFLGVVEFFLGMEGVVSDLPLVEAQVDELFN